MADQGDEWASPGGGFGQAPDARPTGANAEPPRYGERIPGWTPPAPAPPPSGQPASGLLPAPQGYTPPPKPGLIPLHPLSFGQLLGAAFGVLRWNPRATIVPTLVINIVQTAIALGLVAGIGLSAADRISRATGAEQQAIIAGTVAESVVGGLLVIAVSVFGSAVLQGMVVLVVARGAEGLRPRAGEVLRRALKSIWPLIGFALLVAAVEIVAIVVLVLLVIGVATAGAVGVILAVLLGFLGGLAFAAGAAFLLVKLATVPSAIVLERLGIRAAIARSWVLMQGAFWRTFGLFLLVLAMVYLATQLVSFPFSLIGGAIGGLLYPNAGNSNDPSTVIPTLLVSTVPATILSTIVGAIGQVAEVSAFALVYLDRRIRREGLDLELQRFVEQGGTDPLDPVAR
jgi:hypothetical protein